MGKDSSLKINEVKCLWEVVNQLLCPDDTTLMKVLMEELIALQEEKI